MDIVMIPEMSISEATATAQNDDVISGYPIGDYRMTKPYTANELVNDGLVLGRVPATTA